MSDITGAMPLPVSAPRVPQFTMKVGKRAATAARIFDALAVITLVVGGIATLIMVVAFAGANATAEEVDGYMGQAGAGIAKMVTLLVLVGTLIGTIITWAAITLMTVVAGFIAQKADV